MRKFIILSYFLFFASYLLLSSQVHANNITVSNVQLGSQDTGAHTMAIQFDISWEISWRDAGSPSPTANFDAAWVFIKYSLDDGVTWSHATLKTSGTNPAGFSRGAAILAGAGSNVDIVVPPDKYGAFVQIASTNTGLGTLSAANLQFIWDYDSVSSQPKIAMWFYLK